MRRIGVATLAAGISLLLVAAPASAVMTQNQTPCQASGTIQAKDGSVTTANQDSVEFKVPREGVVNYTASVGKLATSYSGKISIDLGLFKYTPSAWTFKGGPQRDPAKTGREVIPSVIKYVPPGKYKISGTRSGDGEICAGYATIVIGGSPFSSPTGIGVMAVTALSFLTFVRSGFAKR